MVRMKHEKHGFHHAYTDAEQKTMESNGWVVEVVPEVVPHETLNIYSMEKDDLEAYALEKHGVNIDKRRGINSLREQVAALDAEKAE